MTRAPWIFAAALAAATLASFAPCATGASKKSTTAPASDLERMSADLEALSRKVSPAVVEIFVSSIAPASAAIDASSLLARQRGSGSGVIVDPSGYIVTNAHVVVGARRIQVQLSEPRSGSPGHSVVKPAGARLEAKMIGLDRETDLAVIKIEGGPFPTLPFGDSEALRQGQVVMAFGSPLGFEGSVSLGVISATVRQIEPDSPMIYLQTDAAIQPGNSGGPLVDTRGSVVGINTFIVGSTAGDALGFAAPSNIVSAIYQQIRKDGRVHRGEIGASFQTVTPEIARGLDLKREWGVIVSDVSPDGPADKAGLLPGDIVTSLEGKPMENGRQLEVNIYRRAAGEEVALEVERDGNPRIVKVTLSERPVDLDRLAALAKPEENLIAPLEILAIPVDSQILNIVPMREPWGVIVVLSTGDAPPGGAPLAPGDVIRSIDKTSVRTLDDLRRGLAAHPSGSWVVLHVERRGKMMYVPCEMP